MPSITLDPAWTPQLPEEVLASERAWLIGVILTGVGYGVVVTLTVMCLIPLTKAARSRQRDVVRTVSLIYVILMFLCATLFMAGGSTMAQYSFIDYRNYPGSGPSPPGPAGFESDMFSIPVSEIGNVSFVVSNWLADAVVVWRCLVVYRGTRFPFWAVCLIPCLTYVTSWIFGLLWLIQVSATSPWNASVNFTLHYFWTSFALNITMTLAIVGRLLFFKYKIAKALGNRHGRHYTSIAAMIVESAVLYTSFQLIFIVLFGLNNATQALFLQPLSQVQCIAPLLIIFRVSCGQAWTTATSTQIMQSAPASHELHSKRTDNTGVRTDLSTFIAARGTDSETKFNSFDDSKA